MEPGINCLVDIQILSTNWCDNVCIAYSGLHALTGYDSTNSFRGIQSKSTLHFVAGDADLCTEMCFISESLEIDPVVYMPCETLNLLCSASNLYRSELFCKRKFQFNHLPPTKDALWHLREQITRPSL